MIELSVWSIVGVLYFWEFIVSPFSHYIMYQNNYRSDEQNRCSLWD